MSSWRESPGFHKDFFLVTSVSVLAGEGSAKDFSRRNGDSWCAFPAGLPWLSSSCFLHASLLCWCIFGAKHIVGCLFLVTSLSSCFFVLGVLTATQPLNHTNFGAVGSSSVCWACFLWGTRSGPAVSGRKQKAHFPTLGHWNPEVCKFGTLEHKKMQRSRGPRFREIQTGLEQVHCPSVSDVSPPRAPTQQQALLPTNSAGFWGV